MHSSVFEISHAPIPMSNGPEPEICLTGSMSGFATMPRTQTWYRGKMLSVSFAGL